MASALASPGGGSRGVVMVDVARLAGVSQKTVSRVVNGAPHVRPAVRERVNRAIEQLRDKLWWTSTNRKPVAS